MSCQPPDLLRAPDQSIPPMCLTERYAQQHPRIDCAGGTDSCWPLRRGQGSLHSHARPHGLQGTQRDVTHPQRALEARLRNARFLAELVKFRVLPFGKFFTLLKVRPVWPSWVLK